MDLLFVKHCSHTQERTALLSALKTNQSKTVAQLAQETSLPRMTVHRNLKRFQEQKIVHATPNAYFLCKRPIDPQTHVFAVCHACSYVNEAIQKKPPKIPGFAHINAALAWSGLCFNCARDYAKHR